MPDWGLDHSEHDCGWLECGPTYYPPKDEPAPAAVKAVPCMSDVTMTATGQLVHLCPHVDEVDYGNVTITWRVDGQTFELHALAEYLRGFRKSRISHEEITDRIRHDLSIVEGVELLSVETTWKTAGMEVGCCTSPTLAAPL